MFKIEALICEFHLEGISAQNPHPWLRPKANMWEPQGRHVSLKWVHSHALESNIVNKTMSNTQLYSLEHKV